MVGFDDSQVAQVMGLTSVRQPLEQVAVELVAALTDLLSAADRPDAEVLLAPSLEIRRSSTRD